MKRISSILFGLPLVFAVGCGSDEPAPEPIRSFSAAYEPGLRVISEGTYSETVERFVNLNGEVTQIDGLDTQATSDQNSGVCQVSQDEKKTVITSVGTEKNSVRVAGKQKAWLLPDSYGDAPADDAVNVWGNPSKGDLFVVKPNLDIFLGERILSGSNKPVEHYLKLYELELALFEEFGEYADWTTTTETDNSATVVSSSFDNGTWNDVFARYNAAGYVWEVDDFIGTDEQYSKGPHNIWADMIVPEKVKVGDTWIDEDNGDIMAAVAIEKVDVGGKNYDALHVVRRGTGNRNVLNAGVAESCIKYATTQTATNPASKTLDAVLTGNCEDGAAGWVNVEHVWYYKGVPIKVESEYTEVTISAYGYAAGNNGDIPSGATTVGAVGGCSLWNKMASPPAVPPVVAKGTPEQIERLQPYAVYSVTKSKYSSVATEIRSNYTLAQEYKENKAAEAAAE